jgi:hypothetical protein
MNAAYPNYMLLDAAKMGSHMDEAIRLNKQNNSLYRGGSEEKLAAVAPYIFSLENEDPLFRWYIKKGWGQSWGFLINSRATLPELHKHFRKFLIVQTEDDRKLYFRFYDPRVLSIFLPTCDREQILEFFGPIAYILAEDETDKNVVRKYEHENGTLKIQKLPLSELVEENAVKI